jgi:hypothetical protein
VHLVKNLLEEVPGYQGSECAHGSVAEKVQVADFLQLLAGAEALYLSAENLAKGHVL